MKTDPAITPTDVPLAFRRAIAADLKSTIKARARHRMTIGDDGARELADALLARFPEAVLVSVLQQEQR